MKITNFITDPQVIRHILEHLGLWVQRPSRDPPSQEAFYHPIALNKAIAGARHKL